MTGLNGHLWVSVFAEIGAKRCQDSGEGWVTTRSCSVNFKISELGLLTCVFFILEKRQDLYRVNILGRTVYIIFLRWISFWNGCILWKSQNVSACCFWVRLWCAASCSTALGIAACITPAPHGLGWGSRGTCWGMLAQAITAGSFPLSSWQAEFEDVSAFSPTLWHGLLLLRACTSNLGWWESAVGTYSGGLWGMGYGACPLLSMVPLEELGWIRQVLSGLCMVLLLKGGVYMTRSSPSVCFSSLKSNPHSVWATWWIRATWWIQATEDHLVAPPEPKLLWYKSVLICKFNSFVEVWMHVSQSVCPI